MKNSNDSKQNMHRRDFIKGSAAASLGLTSGLVGIPSVFGQSSNPSTDSGKAQNAIQIENAKPGTRDWMLTNTYIDPDTWWRSPRIEGYCSETSVSAGDKIKIMVSTNPVAEFSLEIFRTGYYGGDGGRSMKKFESIQGKTQADPEIGENRLRECKWEPSVEFVIPDDWLSGVYLGKLTTKRVEGVYQSRLTAKEGLQSYVIFIVRDDRPCDLLFQCSDMTWQAYNSWPDDQWSLYHSNKFILQGSGRKKWQTEAKTGWASFDRPYANFCQDHIVDRPSSVGSGEFLLWEFPLSYWMEQQGYDVSYLSNLDTHNYGPRLQKAKGFISVGHDEYWSQEMFDNAIAARDAGVNFAFMSGNSVCWETPLTPSSSGQPNRVIHRNGLFFGDVIVAMYNKQIGGDYRAAPNGAQLMGGHHTGLGGGDWICTKPDHWVYEGTDMKDGDILQGLVGWEWHGYPARELPGHEILATSDAVDNNKRPNSTHAATIYNGPKGNVVFNAGTIWWAQGVSSPPGHVLPRNRAKPKVDPRAQRMTKNVFDRFIK